MPVNDVIPYNVKENNDFAAKKCFTAALNHADKLTIGLMKIKLIALRNIRTEHMYQK